MVSQWKPERSWTLHLQPPLFQNVWLRPSVSLARTKIPGLRELLACLIVSHSDPLQASRYRPHKLLTKGSKSQQGRWIGPPGTPGAFETEFGWVLASCLDLCDSHHIVSHYISFTTGDDLLRRFWEIEENPKNEIPSLLRNDPFNISKTTTAAFKLEDSLCLSQRSLTPCHSVNPVLRPSEYSSHLNVPYDPRASSRHLKL